MLRSFTRPSQLNKFNPINKFRNTKKCLQPVHLRFFSSGKPEGEVPPPKKNEGEFDDFVKPEVDSDSPKDAPKDKKGQGTVNSGMGVVFGSIALITGGIFVTKLM